MRKMFACRRSVLMFVVYGIAGCQAGASSGGAVRPGEGPVPADVAPQGRQQGDSLGELEERLTTLRRDQQALVSAAARDPQTCEQLCSLSTSICEVQQRLCELADSHAGEDEYQALCREAKLECREAQESCQACVRAHAEE